MRLAPVGVLLVAISASAWAQTSYIWTGAAGTSSWTTPANWSPNGVPGAAAGDSAAISSAVTVDLSGALANPLAALAVQGGATLALSGSTWTLAVTDGAGAFIVGGASP
ncbi:MAG: hypothetical protein ACOZIN_02365, partial [Myxococcota bacterium]